MQSVCLIVFRVLCVGAHSAKNVRENSRKDQYWPFLAKKKNLFGTFACKKIEILNFLERNVAQCGVCILMSSLRLLSDC